ncbi:MAG: SDR family NAD(P)-dependent oxidoreductase [Pseudomonadales bacterium]|nr:SDR family NAD(P)-dependent oxidoreductase [Pseudomonadales bacterium]
MKSILVTGAGGFIGSHLTEKLVREGAKVKAMVHYNSRNDWGLLELIPKEVRNELEIISGDIQDPFFVDKAVEGCDTVFHLSSLIAIPYSYVAPQTYVATNVGGAVNVMQAAVRHGVSKVVHTSTSECYGTAQYVPIDEKHPLQGQSPYSASKIGADMIAESFWRSFELPVAIIRPFNTYGPRQSARAVIPTIISQALSGKVIKLGSLTPTRDMNFVADTVAGFVQVAKSDRSVGEVINVGSGVEYSIGEIANKIINILQSDSVIESDDQRVRPGKSEVERLLCCNAKAAELLGWKPQVNLDKGLEITIAWLKDNLNRYKANIYNL